MHVLELTEEKFTAQYAPPGHPPRNLEVAFSGPPKEGIKIGQRYPLKISARLQNPEEARALEGSEGFGAKFSYFCNTYYNGAPYNAFAQITPGEGVRLDPRVPEGSWEGWIVFNRAPERETDVINLSLGWRLRLGDTLCPTLTWSYGRPRWQPVVDWTPSPITEADVDRLLDYYAGQLDVAAKARDMTGLFVGEAAADGRELTAGQAADLANAVWDQVRALVRLNISRVVPVTPAQKTRIRVLGHWAAWIIQRTRHMGAYAVGGGLPDAPAIFLKPDAPPGYPLFGEVAMDVPPPPLRTIADEPDDSLYGDEYSRAFLLSAVQCADVYYTRGLMWSAYVTLRDRRIAPLGVAVLCNVPKAGPVLAAVLTSYNEIAHFQELTWDQHIANWSGLINMGLSVAQRSKPKPSEVGDPKQGIFEGGLPKDVKTVMGEDRAFRVVSRKEEGGKQYAEIEYALPGKLENVQTGRRGEMPVVLKRNVEVVNVGGKERFFDRQNGEPIIPVGEEGYHAWSHLTERKCGHRTGEISFLQVFEGTPYGNEVRALISGFSDPQANRVALNGRYVELMNRVVTDFKQTGPSGYLRDMQSAYYYFGKLKLTLEDFKKLYKQDPEANYYISVRNGQGEVNTVRIAYSTGGKMLNAYVHDPEKVIGEGMTRQMYDHWKPSDPRLLIQPALAPYFSPGQ